MPRKKASKTTAKKASTKKVAELNQAHGKVEGPEPTTLDQIWGDTGLSKYRTLDASEYEIYLKQLNKSDLQRHAAEMGIVPVDSREMLSNRLLKEFNRYVASFKMPSASKPNQPVSDKVKKILSEGR
tara:strand:- start:1939 stop:2319 length:381 start_codon:yes stop_codon:yes gene_type:complete